MAERDRIVPVWNSMIGRWEPVDFRNGQQVGVWPHGFRQELLPFPEYPTRCATSRTLLGTGSRERFVGSPHRKQASEVAFAYNDGLLRARLL